MMRTWFRFCLLSIVTAILGTAALAGTKLGPRQLKSIVVPYEYFFYEYQYLQSDTGVLQNHAELLKENSPEGAAARLHAAMLEGSYEKWLTAWDAESRASIAERNTRLKRDETYWINWWKQSLEQFADFELVRRIETKTASQTIVIVHIRFTGPKKEPIQSHIVLTQDADGTWYANNAVASDPVVQFSHIDNSDDFGPFLKRAVDEMNDLSTSMPTD